VSTTRQPKGNGREAGRKPSREEIEQATQLVDQAEQLIAEVLEPGQWPGPDEVGRFMSEGRLERTLALYLQAIRLDPLEPAYPWNLASTLSRLGLSEVAFALIAQAIHVGEETGQKDWTGAGEHLALAETALEAGQDDMAVVAIARATEIDSDSQVRAQARRLLNEIRESGDGEPPELRLATRLSRISG
jgi:tetratricopeptide (TPR) repeat protein